MYTVSPEDRLRLVARQQDEWRQQASVDRGFAVDSTSSVTPEAPEPEHHRILAFRHLFHVLARGHGAAPRGAAH